MTDENTSSTSSLAQKTHSLHLVCSSGGTRAFLTNTGAIIALKLAGIEHFDTIGGVSGGSLATLMLAGGMPVSRLLSTAMEMDFSQLVERTKSFSDFFRSLLKVKGMHRRLRLAKGYMLTDKLGEFAESLVPVWPKNFWTMAVSGQSQFVFTANGVFEYMDGKMVRQISDTPAPVALAIRATCAVPGVLEAIEYDGRFLFDGAMGPHGKCPTDMAQIHFQANKSEIVACDLMHHLKRRNRLMTRFGKILTGSLGKHLLAHKNKSKPDKKSKKKSQVVTQAGLLIMADVDSIQSLQFDLSRNQKEQIILLGFAAAVEALSAAGLLPAGERMEAAQKATTSFKDLEALAKGFSE